VTATRWRYFAPYQDDVAAALTTLQRSVLASGDFRWPESGGEGLGPRPTTLQELAAVRRTEAFWLEGTHSILDMDRVVESGEAPVDGTVRGMSPEEIAAIFQAERPTRERFEAAYEAGKLGVDRGRWSGRWLVLFDGPALSEIAFWGSSGD
jgi:hypothetical protein